MRILTRYVLREVLGSALIGVAVFSFILFTRDLGRILELVVRNSAPLPSVAQIFLFTLPVALTYTIPMECWWVFSLDLDAWRQTVKSRPCAPAALAFGASFECWLFSWPWLGLWHY